MTHATVRKVVALLTLGGLLVGCQRPTQPVRSTTDAEAIQPRSAPPAGYTFASPVRIEADGKPVSVEAPGYACPTVADVDGDDREDLVVGQFANGNLQFFRNTAMADESPRLAAGEWIKTGENRALVPGVW